MFACFRSFKREISLMAVQGAPSSCSRRISFSATNFPVILVRRRRRRERVCVFNRKREQIYIKILITGRGIILFVGVTHIILWERHFTCIHSR